MIQLILLVTILMALAYLWNPTLIKVGGSRKKGGGFRFTFKKNDSPFQGRHRAAPKGPHAVVDKGSMMRCHNCGSFFSESKVVREVVEGHILEFCSDTCQKMFHAPRRG